MIEFTSTYNCEFCSGHNSKLQVINPQSLAIFTFSPCQRRVNQPQRPPPKFQLKSTNMTQIK